MYPSSSSLAADLFFFVFAQHIYFNPDALLYIPKLIFVLYVAQLNGFLLF